MFPPYSHVGRSVAYFAVCASAVRLTGWWERWRGQRKVDVVAESERAPAALELVVRQCGRLTHTEKQEIIDLCTRAFSDEAFGILFDLVPPTSMHVLARLDGRLVGHACWNARRLYVDDRLVMRTAYVDAVAAEPARQGEGIGSAVLSRLAAETRGYELGGLSTSRVSFYERLGWERWRGPTGVRSPEGLTPTPDDTVMILRTPHTPPGVVNDGATWLICEPRGESPW